MGKNPRKRARVGRITHVMGLPVLDEEPADPVGQLRAAIDETQRRQDEITAMLAELRDTLHNVREAVARGGRDD